MPSLKLKHEVLFEAPSSISRTGDLGRCIVMFRGGRDSLTSLLLTREVFPDVEALFVDTGITLPSVLDYVKDTCKGLV